MNKVRKRIAWFIALGLIFITFPIGVNAEEEETEEICNITLKNTNYKDADLLDGGGFYSVNYSIVNNPEKTLYLPQKKDVRDAITNVLKQLDSKNVNLDTLATEKLSYEIVNVDVLGVAGHAFVVHPKPTIYLYGKHDNRLVAPSYVKQTTIHEMGHYIEANYFTHEDRQKYRKLRGIPLAWVHQSPNIENWGYSFVEIFAEDFKNVFLKDSYNKTALRDVPESMKKDIRDFIIDVIKRKTGDKAFTNDLYQFLLNNKDIYNLDVLMCQNQLSGFLSKDLTGKDAWKWLTDYLRTTNKEYHHYLQVINVPNSVDEKGLTLHDGKMSTRTLLKTVDDLRVISKWYSKSLKNSYWETYLTNNQKNGFHNLHLTLMERGNLPQTFQPPLNQSEVLTKEEAVHWLYLNLPVKELEYQPNVKTTNEFKDIPIGHPYAHEIYTLRDLGIIKGSTPTQFGWNQPLTKLGVFHLLNKAYQFQFTSTLNFEGKEKISPVYQKDIDALYENQIITRNQIRVPNLKSKIQMDEYLTLLQNAFLMTITDKELTQFSGDILTELNQIQVEIETYPVMTHWQNRDMFQLIQKQSAK